MRADRNAPDRDGERRLAAHVEECPHCRAEGVDTVRVAAWLDVESAMPNTAMLSRRTLVAARPALRRRAAAVWRRRVATSLLLALLPLPLILAYDAYVLRAAYELLRMLLPSGVALYVLATYTAVVSLLFALTYAAIPVLLAQRAGPDDAVAM